MEQKEGYGTVLDDKLKPAPDFKPRNLGPVCVVDLSGLIGLSDQAASFIQEKLQLAREHAQDHEPVYALVDPEAPWELHEAICEADAFPMTKPDWFDVGTIDALSENDRAHLCGRLFPEQMTFDLTAQEQEFAKAAIAEGAARRAEEQGHSARKDMDEGPIEADPQTEERVSDFLILQQFSTGF